MYDVIFIVFAILCLLLAFCVALALCCSYILRGNKAKSTKKVDFELVYMNASLRETRDIFVGAIDAQVDKKDDKYIGFNLETPNAYVIVYDPKNDPVFESFNMLLKSLLYVETNDAELVIQLNCPGGNMYDFGEAAYLLQQLREKMQIFIYTDKVAASGGYLLACIGHKIYSNEFDHIGSIGVYADSFNAKKLFETIGVSMQRYRSGKFKGLGHFGSEPTAEESAHIDAEVKRSHEICAAFVKKFRPDCKESTCFEGDCLLARDALRDGLIDGIGNISDYYREHIDDRNIFQVKSTKKESGIKEKMFSLMF